MGKTFVPYTLDQRLLLPPDMRNWLPGGHLALFVSDVVEKLDLKPIVGSYEEGDGRGQPPYHPQMMVKLLVYGYCTGKASSRKIERATYEEVAYRLLSGDQHPDHDSIAHFRKRHLKALAGMFLEVLKLCQKAGLVKLGHVALDGTKVKANASKHKAMSYGRMEEAQKKLKEEVERLLREAQEIDEAEDREYGKGRRGDELPKELARRESRLRKIQEAKEALEREAKEEAERALQEAQAKIEERRRKEVESGKKIGGKKPQIPQVEEAKPEAKAQRNFTDPDSRIMKDGASKGFEQAYNAQLAVDSESQIIVAAAITQETNDKRQLVPMAQKIKENMGVLPLWMSGDTGYFSESNVTDETLKGVDLYVPPDRLKHGAQEVEAKPSPEGTVTEEMRQKLRTEAGRGIYKMRKAIVEPVIGQIKEIRGFRRFLLRGLAQVEAEWLFICLTHNLLKLFRAAGGSCRGHEKIEKGRPGWMNLAMVEDFPTPFTSLERLFGGLNNLIGLTKRIIPTGS